MSSSSLATNRAVYLVLISTNMYLEVNKLNLLSASHWGIIFSKIVLLISSVELGRTIWRQANFLRQVAH